MSKNGYNPLRWDCDERGCFNVKSRPKIEIFADDLPGKIALQDIDATVEVAGRFLFLDWKYGEPRDIPTGQRIYAERLTAISERITYVFVCGDAETMEVSRTRIVHNGRVGDWEPCNLEGLHRRIKAWQCKR